MPSEIPAEMAAGDIGLSTMLPTFSKLASAPTRVAEYLAAGMPVGALAGVGDLDRLLSEARVGVTLRDSTPESIAAAAADLRSLAADPDTPRSSSITSTARRHQPSSTARTPRVSATRSP